MNPHEEFLELGLVAASGELTDEERVRLDEHLSRCASCREALKDLETTMLTAIPRLAPEVSPDDTKVPWSEEKAQARLFEHLDREDRKTGAEAGTYGWHRAYFPSRVRWDLLGLSTAAIVLFALALGVTAYRSAKRPGNGTSNVEGTSAAAVEEQLADAGYEARTLKGQLAEKDQAIADLKQEMQRESAQLAELKEKLGKSAAPAPSREAGNNVLVAENERLAQQASAAVARYDELERKSAELEHKKAEESARADALEAKIAGLTGDLRGKDETIARQTEYLDHDRDIRELMGARDLYIAEIYDVERTGQTNKPYGRVFYTRGKSLVFYAYDLDQEAGFKQASTFQAWGSRRGLDNKQAMNLGVFYEDNATKKRWVVRSDDPNMLKEIDAVFVTVEPNGGSTHPSSQPLLFAYLRVQPNHP